MTTREQARLRLAALAVFRGLRSDPVVAALAALLQSAHLPLYRQVERYARFAGLLYEAGGNWSEYLLQAVLCDENRYVVLRGAGAPVPPVLEQALGKELKSLQALSLLQPAQLANELDCGIPLAQWDTAALDFAACYHQRMQQIAQQGYGIFARHHMFLVRAGELVPVQNPDPVEEAALTGYARERGLVRANTIALLQGRPAANVLLYGDSGTGKSTCVKAVANELRGQGLRLVELRKDQLEQIPLLIDRLSGNPLKFIVFIDDLSFAGNSDHFSALKAALEGSVSARAANMAIYATSNRRHLVRERFSEREGDDVHIRDTLEETGSLSERFGLTVTFLRPDRELYASIAAHWCRRLGVAFSEQTRREAEAWALRCGGRSARAAKQFAEHLAAQSP